MMRHAPVAGLILVLLASPALAHGPFDGRWGFDAETCELEPGTSDLVPVVIHGADIRYYESQCGISDLAPIGTGNTQAWRLTLTCSGEGETWSSEAIFAIDYGTSDRRPQLIEIDIASGAVTVRQACDWP